MVMPIGRVRLWRDGALVCERNNLVVNAGLPAFAETTSGATAYKVAAIGFGSGGTTPALNDTDLTGPLKYYNAVGAATFPSSGTVQFAFAIQGADYAAYGMTIQELGLFANSAAVTIPAVAGFNYSAWAASSNQPVGNLVKSAAGNPFRSTTPPAWVASTVEAVGNLIIDSNGNLQAVTTAGTTKTGTAPAWAATLNATTADNTVVWTCKALAGYTPVTAATVPTWVTSAIGALTYDGTVAWSYLAALVIPTPMVAHAVVPSFVFSGSASYSGTWSLTF